MKLTPPEVIETKHHRIVVTHRAEIGLAVAARIETKGGKLRHYAESMMDARTIAGLCDRLYPTFSYKGA